MTKNAVPLKKIHELENDKSAIVIYQDEVHFQVTTSITRKWAEKGSKPQVKSAPLHKNVAYSGYVVPATGELIVIKSTWFNYETVIESFRNFIKMYEREERIYLVLDNAPWHKKAVRLVQTEALAEYQDIRDKLTLIFLPPYSPDLNPIEQCWRVTRREVTHNTYFENEVILEQTLDEYYYPFRQPNDKFKSLCLFKCKN